MKIFCHLNPGVTFRPLLCSPCWLICFVGYVADVSSVLDLTSILNVWGEMAQVLSFCFPLYLVSGHANRRNSINICSVTMRKKRRREGKEKETPEEIMVIENSRLKQSECTASC